MSGTCIPISLEDICLTAGDTLVINPLTFTFSTGVTIVSSKASVKGSYSFKYDLDTSNDATTVTIADVDGTITSEWKSGTYEYDIEVTRSDGIVRTYIKGNIIVSEGVA